MRFLNIPCSYCNNRFAETDDVVTCPTCGSPHHRDCWKEHDCCANEALHAQGFVWKAPEEANKNDNPAEKKAVDHAQPALHTVECPFCGAQNYSNELYCSVCHEPIHQNASADAGEPLQDEEQREKMYADFRTYGGLDPQSYVDDITVMEYSAYVGAKSGSYVRRFMSIHAFKKTVSWNWPAFWLTAVSMFSSVVLGPVWFFYRKLNKIGSLFLAVLLVLGVASAVVYASDPAYAQLTQSTQALYTDYLEQAQQGDVDPVQLIEDMQLNLASIAETYASNCSALTNVWSYITDILYSFVLPVLVALFATVFYYKKAKADILSVRQQYGSQPEYLNRLSLKGGVSAGGAVIAAVLCFAVFMIQQYLPLIIIAFKS